MEDERYEVDCSLAMTGTGLVFLDVRRLEFWAEFQAIDAPSHIAGGSVWKHHDYINQREILRDYML